MTCTLRQPARSHSGPYPPPPLTILNLSLFRLEFRYIDKNTAGLVGNGGGAASAGLPNPTDVGSGRVPRGPLAVPDALRAAAKAAGLTLEMPVRMGGEGGGPSAAALDALSEHLTASSVDADFKAERAAAAAAAAEDAQADGTAAIEVSGEIPEEVVGVGDTAFFPPAGAKATIEDNFFSGEQEEDDVDHDDGGGNDGGQKNDNQRKSETKEREEKRTSLTPTTTGAAPGTTLEPGQTVSVTGLARKPALNGQLGTVLEKDAWLDFSLSLSRCLAPSHSRSLRLLLSMREDIVVGLKG